MIRNENKRNGWIRYTNHVSAWIITMAIQKGHCAIVATFKVQIYIFDVILIVNHFLQFDDILPIWREGWRHENINVDNNFIHKNWTDVFPFANGAIIWQSIKMFGLRKNVNCTIKFAGDHTNIAGKNK
jgi:hypothetical protein